MINFRTTKKYLIPNTSNPSFNAIDKFNNISNDVLTG